MTKNKTMSPERYIPDGNVEGYVVTRNGRLVASSKTAKSAELAAAFLKEDFPHCNFIIYAISRKD